MVRDAQCTEKEAIKKEVGAEQKRLDDEMEVDRVNAIRIEEEIARKRKNERMIGAMMIMDQIKHNEQVRAAPLCSLIPPPHHHRHQIFVVKVKFHYASWFEAGSS